jgi:hypothetical protein
MSFPVFIPIDIVSYLNISFHTCDNLFHTYTSCCLRTIVISYLRQPVSCLLLVGIVSYLHMSFPAFIPIGIVSYLHISFHTCDNLFHTYRYDFIPAHVILYLHCFRPKHIIHTCNNLFHTYTYCFIPTHVISDEICVTNLIVRAFINNSCN